MRRIVFEPGPKRLDASAVHSSNLRSVLAAIAANPGSTAADTGRITGLSPATVSRLIDDLLGRNLLLQGDRVRGRRGQPGLALWLNPEGAYSAGCQIGFGQCYLFIRSLGGQILHEQEFAIEQCSYSHVAAAVGRAFDLAMKRQEPIVRERFVGLGVAAPADFDRLCQTVLGTHSEGWDERTFCAELQRTIDVPVTMYSTGAAGAWAELAATPHPRPADYLYLFVDRFVQSGMLLDGKLWVAPQARHGGLGRMLVAQEAQSARVYDLVGAQSWLQEVAMADGANKDEVVARWASKAAAALAQSVQALTDAMDLPLLVIDGSLPPDLVGTLIAEMTSQLPQYAWANPPHVKRGVAGAHAPAKGAALRPLYNAFFSDEISVDG
ncbi:ROK family transcriptional regulator [Devosia sp. SL43]|uniref:ROK family transcriptional regulator n=1 Tax=Devosia sp. SL43 TaxID=2806348 RepID=UPI001F385BF1|nr:ROK family transcriptional regulator [Devosia sp. SL43]UJW85555.1 ROK family transcriptional regulator [Devosia sp. SL43]